MKLRLTLISICFTLSILSAQQDCVYVPLEFDDITPEWRHLSIDSNYIDLNFDPPGGTFDYDYYYGTRQVLWDRGSFVIDEHLYSISQNSHGLDYAGVLIEKINVNDGSLVWQTANDPTRVTFREKPTAIEVDGNILRLRGVYTDRHLIAGLAGGRQEGAYFIREYDMETGALLHYHAPPLSDSTHMMASTRDDNFYYRDRNTIEHYEVHLRFRGPNYKIRSGHIRRFTSDSLGQLLSGPDTIHEMAYQDIEIQESRRGRTLLETPEGNFILAESVSPKDTTLHPRTGQISLFDKDFNTLKVVDLAGLYGSFGYIDIESADDEKFVLQLCHNEDFDAIGCPESRFIIMDHELNIIRAIKGDFEERVFSRKDDFTLDGQLVWAYNEPGHNWPTRITLYQENAAGTTEPIKQFYFKQFPYYNGTVNKIIQLPDGDLLMRIWHGCTSATSSGIVQSYNEWFRFAAEDIQLLSSTEEISSIETPTHILFPNPTVNELTIRTANPMGGSISIHGINGKIMQQIEIMHGTEATLKLEGLPAGAYVLRYHDTDQNTFWREKFIKL